MTVRGLSAGIGNVFVDTTMVDRGWNKVVSEIKKLDGSYVKVGLPENGKIQPGSKQGSGNDDVSTMSELVTIGAVQEYGAPNRGIPSRPFMRITFDKSVNALKNIKVKLINEIYDGKSTVEHALNKIGIWYSAKIKATITALKDPPNDPKTIKRKGSSNPLIDSSQMRNSITHVIKTGSGA